VTALSWRVNHSILRTIFPEVALKLFKKKQDILREAGQEHEAEQMALCGGFM